MCGETVKFTKICNCASTTCHTCICSKNVNFSTTLYCLEWVSPLLPLWYPVTLLVAVFPSPAAQLALLCNVCGTGVFCCRWRNKFWRNLVLTGCDQVMQYHIPEEQNPQLCYCEPSKLMKKCVLREPGSSSPSPHFIQGLVNKNYVCICCYSDPLYTLYTHYAPFNPKITRWWLQIINADSWMIVFWVWHHISSYIMLELRRLSPDKLWSSSCMQRILKYMLVWTLI